MKKIISMILAIIITVALTACTEEKTISPTIPSTNPSTIPSTEPTIGSPNGIDGTPLEERLLLYREIVSKLFQCSERDGIFVAISAPGGPYFGNEGLEYCYRQLLDMEDLDPYLTEEGWKENVYQHTIPASYLDRKAILSRFTIIEDVPLGLTYTKNNDTFGEVDYGEQVTWRYNTKGQLVHLDQSSSTMGTFRLPENRFYNNICFLELFYEYDDNGDLTYAWFGKNQTAEFPIVPTYDNAGRLISEVANNQTLLYFYNERGDLSKVKFLRITSIDGDQVYYTNDYWDFTYQYDDAGNITQRVEKEYKSGDLMFTRTEEYSYDDKGQVCAVKSSTDVWEWYAEEPYISNTIKNTIRYTYDEKGRILTRSVCSGGEPDANGTPTYESILYTETYLYGDHYIFDNYEVEFASAEEKAR